MPLSVSASLRRSSSARKISSACSPSTSASSIPARLTQVGCLLVQARGLGPPAGAHHVATHRLRLSLDSCDRRTSCGDRALGSSGRQPAGGRRGPPARPRSRLGTPASGVPHPAPVDPSDARRRCAGATAHSADVHGPRGRPHVRVARTRLELGRSAANAWRPSSASAATPKSPPITIATCSGLKPIVTRRAPQNTPNAASAASRCRLRESSRDIAWEG